MRLIDVDALLAQMKECYERRAEEANMTGDRAVCVTWRDTVILIKGAPTVDAVPVRHGRWKCVNNDRYACSLCGFEPWYEGSISTLHYCPNCGANMRGEKE